MRFITPVILSILIGILVWQSLDIGAYQNHHITKNTYPVKESEVFFQKVHVVQTPGDETWLLNIID
jgi:hypothetical protein